jgi:UDP-GlcNAc:undecaprenyl-phosphate GlcNAc-1-phosphate transferase
MYILIVCGCISCALSLLLTPIVRKISQRWNLLDYPDVRKHHASPVARVGGIAIAISFISTYGVLTLLPLQDEAGILTPLSIFVRLLPSALLIFCLGLIDDLVVLRPWYKFSGQIVAACGAYLAGIHIQAFGGHFFADWWSFPLTVFWIVLCTNAVNLIDGVDGLAAGVGLFATVTMLVAALLQGNFALALAAIPLAGSLLGFLRYNFSPATIFLGDSGSQFVGFLLGCYGVLWSEKAATILGMTAPLVALSVPLIDTGLAIVRRFLTRKPIFGADRGHIHHRLLDQGLTPRRVVMLIYGLCSIAAAFSLVMSSSQRFGRVGILLFCVIACFGVAQLRYIEFRVVGRMFMEDAFRRQLSSQILIHRYELTLSVASKSEECWMVIENACREFGFQGVRLSLGDRTYEYRNDSESNNCWKMHVPLSDRAYIDLYGRFGEMPHIGSIGPFADMLHRTLPLAAGTFDRKDSHRVMSHSA